MKIRIGALNYRIRFTDERLYLNRKCVCAICDHQTHELRISNTTTAQQMGDVIGEAVARIWKYNQANHTSALLRSNVYQATD